jgi:aromatic ring-opening dioxygenase LigB subunit
VLTPHNVHVEGHFAVVLAGTLAGRLAEFDAPEVELSCPIDLELATQTIVALHDEGVPVVGASFGANDPGAATAPMDWGVLIPLWYMGGRSDPQVPAVVVSPARDRTVDEHVRAGRTVAEAAAASGRRVALIASADHGHAHDADGPYGFDPAAATTTHTSSSWSARTACRPPRARSGPRRRREGRQLVAATHAPRRPRRRVEGRLSVLRSINLFRDALCRVCT